MTTTDTPRTDACPYCGSSFSNATGKHSCRFDLVTNGRTKLCLTAEALIRASKQNTELKAEVERMRGKHNKMEEEIEQLNIAGATAVEAAKIFRAEVERLSGQLIRAVSIAGVLLADIEDFHGNATDEEWTSSGWNDSRISKSLLEKLKEEIK